MLLGFEHIGIAVSDMDRSIGFYRDLLGLKLVLRKHEPETGTDMAFLDAGGGQLEIVTPAPGLVPASDLPPTQAGLRHVTFAVDDVDETFGELVAAGVTPIEPPRDAKTRELLSRVAFVRDPDGIVIELVSRATPET